MSTTTTTANPKVKAFVATINRTGLVKKLTGYFQLPERTKLPGNFEGFALLNCLPTDKFDGSGCRRYLAKRGHFHVTVTQAKRQGVPRIFIDCDCGKRVPFGRVNQHTHSAAFGQIDFSESLIP